ncbi:hypothetical protein QF042_001875 [Pedobacter sp. W3I1]|uniref:hypothetical protein n=1 Tax=Pedobacter sp. W3I1 TaxID=3042291 RepID=UPI00277EF87C|nr:hypothetical protein [Pedobacter sp. W3I1]MDQ0638310.1 hypothetical protein [Pedobacter sp. W3I1]
MMKKLLLILFLLQPFILMAQYGKEVVASPSQQLYVFLGALPPSDGSNFQKMKVEILGGAWESYSTGETVFYISNRNELRITKFTNGGLSDRYSLHAYNNANGNIDFYLITSNWIAMAVKSCMLGGDATRLIVNTVTESLPAGLVEITPLNIKPILTSDYDGNMAINMASPDGNYKLSVNGKMRTKEVRVDALNWPDYVFDDAYPIGTLKELESYITANKHLPDMPTAKEIEANGLELGEMVKMQQKKIEELTLHLISLDKKVGALERENRKLKVKHK